MLRIEDIKKNISANTSAISDVNTRVDDIKNYMNSNILTLQSLCLNKENIMGSWTLRSWRLAKGNKSSREFKSFIFEQNFHIQGYPFIKLFSLRPIFNFFF